MSAAVIVPGKPRPERTRVLLVSSGLHDATWTVHNYAYTRKARLAHGDGEAWEHVFRCTKTGALRRFGTARIDEAATGDEGGEE